MKWNIALVLFLALLLTIRFLIVSNRYGSDVDQQQIRITPISIKKEKKGADIFHTESPDIASDKLVGTVENNGQDVESESALVRGVKENEEGNGRVRVSMYNSKPFDKEMDKFLPSDRIYVSGMFSSLKAGKYNVVTHWKTPKGDIARKIVRQLNLQKDVENYRVYFWFQLVEKGLFSNMLTGSKYKDKVYGQWQVLLYLNEEQVMIKNFVISEL